MMRAALTLAVLAYIGYQDFRWREFDDLPLIAGIAAGLPLAALEYYAIYLYDPILIAPWLGCAIAFSAAMILLWKTGFIEDGDALTSAFTFTLNAASPIDPFEPSPFLLVLLACAAAACIPQLAWWRREIPARLIAEKPTRYIYVRGIPQIDALREESRRVPPGSFTIDHAAPAIREMIARGELTGEERVLAELAAPFCTALLAAYAAALLIDWLVL